MTNTRQYREILQRSPRVDDIARPPSALYPDGWLERIRAIEEGRATPLDWWVEIEAKRIIEHEDAERWNALIAFLDLRSQRRRRGPRFMDLASPAYLPDGPELHTIRISGGVL